MSAASLQPSAEGGWALDDQDGFPALIGPIWVQRGPNARYGLVVQPQHLNRNGALHGGMTTALFDHAIGFVAHDAAAAHRLVTIQLGVQFIGGAAIGDFLELESEVVRQTGSYLFMRGLCRCRNRVLATADGIWKKLNK